MHNQENCYKNVWILSGTSDGPEIANKLLELNYSVFASVLTYKAGQAYVENPKLHIITGKLNNKDEIINLLIFLSSAASSLLISGHLPFSRFSSSHALSLSSLKIKSP